MPKALHNRTNGRKFHFAFFTFSQKILSVFCTNRYEIGSICAVIPIRMSCRRNAIFVLEFVRHWSLWSRRCKIAYNNLIMINEIRPKNNVFSLCDFIGRKTVFSFEGFDEMRNTLITDIETYLRNVFL